MLDSASDYFAETPGRFTFAEELVFYIPEHLAAMLGPEGVAYNVYDKRALECLIDLGVIDSLTQQWLRNATTHLGRPGETDPKWIINHCTNAGAFVEIPICIQASRFKGLKSLRVIFSIFSFYFS